ncbi:hypothetical protein BC629DRAFT_968094 [Irpex lacteus]|nr:hypothetical protein BC629DRAFT_968094 [Irpex lacteus]
MTIIPRRYAELARIFYSQWNVYIDTAIDDDTFVGRGLRANDPRAQTFYDAYAFLQRNVVFHFRLNLEIAEYFSNTTKDHHDALMNPLVAYAAYILLDVPFATSFNDEQENSWAILSKAHGDLHGYDWKAWAADNEERKAVLGLEYPSDPSVEAITEELTCGFMGDAKMERWLGAYLRRIQFNHVSKPLSS